MRAVSRRGALQIIGGLPLACTGDDPTRCAEASTHTGGRYCLIEPLRVRVTAAVELAIGEAVLHAVDDGTAVIVARDAGGWFARSAICTHACCVVSLCGEPACSSLTATPEACEQSPVRPLGLALCPCHGSRFQLADGMPLDGPATTPLPSLALTLDGDDAVVDTGVEVDPEARFIEA